jgi:hypothetical protein
MNPRARKRSRAAAKKYPKLLRRWDASKYLLEVHGLQFAPGTLAKFACEGTGPEIHFVNKLPFYRPAGLDAWAKTKFGKPTPRAQKDPHHRNRNKASRQSRQQRDPPPASTEPPAAAA